MNEIAALGYVLGILIFAYIIRKKRKSLIQDRMDKMKSKKHNLEEEKQHD